MNAAINLPGRATWLRAFQQGDRERQAELAGRLARRHGARHRRVPLAGLGMLRLREPCLGDDLLLGEFPLAEAEVGIPLPGGDEAVGAARVMDDDEARAVDLAVLDAVLAHRLDGWEEARALLLEGAAAVAATDRWRAALLASTRVDFSALETDEGR